MTDYRVYWFNERGKIVWGEDIAAKDDLAALDAAEQFSRDSEVEIWHGDRKVARFKKGGVPLDVKDAQSL